MAPIDTLGTRIRAARLAKQLSQQQLAERIGITRAAVAKWETGASNSIRSHHLDALARILALPIADLLGQTSAGFAVREALADYGQSSGRLRFDQWRLLDLWERLPEADRAALFVQLEALVNHRAAQPKKISLSRS